MPFPAIPSQIRCPNCDTPFVVQVRTVIDIGEEPELKEQFLRGEINHAQCPQCSSGGMLTTPLVYHDPDKELLITFVPPELGLSSEEQERTVGSLIQAVMNNVPQEERKGYFLQPKTVLTYNGLIELVLEGEGISKEMLNEQRDRLNLINDLIEALDDKDTFISLIDEHKDALQYEFFLMLSDLVEAEGERLAEDEENRLATLRERLLEHVSPTVSGAASGDMTADNLIDLLLEAESDEAWARTVPLHLHRLDYSFFQALTSRLEAAEAEGDQKALESLGRLRQRLLDELDRTSQQAREAEDEASLLIMEMLEAQDVQSDVRAHADELDDIFFLVLARLHQTATNRNNTQRAERLKALLDAARDVREEKLPPEVRLVSQLLRADYPEESEQVLENNRGLLNDELLQIYDRYLEQIRETLDEATRERLDQIREQIVAKITILRA